MIFVLELLPCFCLLLSTFKQITISAGKKSNKLLFIYFWSMLQEQVGSILNKHCNEMAGFLTDYSLNPYEGAIVTACTATPGDDRMVHKRSSIASRHQTRS